MTHKLKSLDSYEVRGNKVFIVGSPVSAPRDAIRAAIESPIEIDGVLHEVVAVEVRMPGHDVAVGEPIGLMVKVAA